MMIKRILPALLFLLVYNTGTARTINSFHSASRMHFTNSASYNVDMRLNATDSVKEKKHSPHKASIYSAIVPGLGQAYNRKYWKIPIIYAALGISGYLIKYNREEMLWRQNELKVRLDGDSTTKPSADLAKITTEQLTADRNYYRTNRDYSIIACAAFYVINIVDAAIDAHFYKFNIDKPLSDHKVRHFYLVQSRVQSVPTVGLAYRF